MAHRYKTKIKYIVIMLFCQLFFLNSAEATKWELLRYELYGGISTFSYFGEIGGSASDDNLFGIKDISILSSRPSLFFGGRYYLRERIAVQPSFYIGFMHGSDKNSKYDNRAYEFTTSFFLPRINLEYAIIKVNDLFGKKKSSFLTYTKSNNKTFIVSVNAGAGYGLYHVSINDAMQATKTSTDALSNPVNYIDNNQSGTLLWNAGFGVKYFFITPLAININLEYNAALTDNIDGFVTSSNKNDIFWIVSFGLTYRIPTNEWGKIDFRKKKKTTKNADKNNP